MPEMLVKSNYILFAELYPLGNRLSRIHAVRI